MDTDCSVLPRDWNGLKALKHEQLFQDNSKMISEDLAFMKVWQKFESSSGSLNRDISAGNDFDAFLNEIEKEEENIFVNIVFMDNLKLARQEIDDDYKLVTFKNT